MTWMVGIDEAGYGPNLGPLVMTAVACRVPDGLPPPDLWDVLAAAVRRAGDRPDSRLLVADSKVVHSGPNGLAALELGVLTTLPPRSPTLHNYVATLSPDGVAELAEEPWYHGRTPLPAATPAADLFARTWRDCQLDWGHARAVVVCASRFNRVAGQWGSKGAVLAEGLTDLVRWAGGLAGDDPVQVTADKHGGRNAYAPMLQHAVPSGLILAQQEGMLRSVYRLTGGPRPMSFTFQPRADAEHFLVALASMVSKYLRELLMAEFNAFWQRHIPGLRPTAGYPGDATRFFEAIRSRAAELGQCESSIWRSR